MSATTEPYVPNDHYYKYDLAWLVKAITNVQDELAQAIDLRTIHYADPIEWDITTQYQANTVVIDNKTGTAYISSQNVPAGVLLTNTKYWNVIFNYNDGLEKLRTTIASNEYKNTTASRDYSKGEFLYLNAELYVVTKNINAADALRDGTNIEKATLTNYIANYDRVTETITLHGTTNATATRSSGDVHVYNAATKAIEIIKEEDK